MNLPNLTGLLGQLAPILRVLGIDPAKIANKWGRAQVAPKFEEAIPFVVSRLERDGLTPALKGDSPAAERLVIRAAMYLLAKEVVFGLGLKKGANLAADFLRDAHDDQVVALVAPQIDQATPTEALVRLVAREWIERIF